MKVSWAAADPTERGAGVSRALQELLMRIMQMADNAGATDEHRALNYLAVRYPAVYAAAAEAFGRNSSLTAVDARLSSLSSIRKLVEVIFSFTNRKQMLARGFLFAWM